MLTFLKTLTSRVSKFDTVTSSGPQINIIYHKYWHESFSTMKRNYQQVHGKKSIGLKYILTIYIINQINLYEKNLAISIVTFFILQTQAFFFQVRKKKLCPVNSMTSCPMLGCTSLVGHRVILVVAFWPNILGRWQGHTNGTLSFYECMLSGGNTRE